MQTLLGDLPMLQYSVSAIETLTPVNSIGITETSAGVAEVQKVVISSDVGFTKEVQSLSLDAAATAGSFDVNLSGASTSVTVPFDATAADFKVCDRLFELRQGMAHFASPSPRCYENWLLSGRLRGRRCYLGRLALLRCCMNQTLGVSGIHPTDDVVFLRVSRLLYRVEVGFDMLEGSCKPSWRAAGQSTVQS